jgi:hypothetical protein
LLDALIEFHNGLGCLWLFSQFPTFRPLEGLECPYLVLNSPLEKNFALSSIGKN